MANIYIFKGDSTTFAESTKFLTFHIQTSLDLVGWKAEFILGSIKKVVDDIASKTFEIILTKEETAQLLYGQRNGSVKLIDGQGQVKTVNNTIPFEVGNVVMDNKHEFIELSIPQTTGIDLTLEIGSSGGGTDNYNELFNKPEINSIKLQGNKTLDDLGIQAKGSYATSAELQALSEKQSSTDDEVNFITGEVTDIKQELPKKLEVTNIVQGSNITLDKDGNNITINSTATGGASDYSELTGKPQINSVELVGNKTLEQLGIQPKGDYLTSVPPEYVTDTELNAKDYATKNELTNKLEVTNILQGENITLDKVGNNITINSTATGGTSNYLDLTNKPKINNVELTGEKTLDDLGIQEKGNYLTSIPSQYVTDTKLSEELAKKQDVGDYATTEDLANIFNNTDVVIDYYPKTEEEKAQANGNYWRKYKSGRLEQGGVQPASTKDNNTVVFMKPFANENYVLLVTVEALGDAGTIYNRQIFAKATTHFNAFAPQNKYKGFDWYATGQGA